MIKAVIFDYDGVIADTVPININAFKATILKYGMKVSKKETPKLIGTSLVDKVNFINTKYKAKINFVEFEKKYEQIKVRLLKKLKLNLGVRTLIKDLQNNHIKIAIATSNVRRKLNKQLRLIGLQGVFKKVMISEDIKKNKPDPQIYFKIAKKLKIEPKNCVVIEDAINGIISAKRAKMKVVAFLNPYQSKKIMSEKADLAVSSLTKLSWRKIKNL